MMVAMIIRLLKTLTEQGLYMDLSFSCLYMAKQVLYMDLSFFFLLVFLCGKHYTTSSQFVDLHSFQRVWGLHGLGSALLF